MTDTTDMNAVFDSARFAREELAAVPVADGRPGVCDICNAPCESERCASCRAVLGTHVNDIPVSIITLTRLHGTVAVAIRAYRESLDPHTRDLAARKLGWLTQRFMTVHEPCLAQRVGRDRFDAIVPMPHSSRRGATQPLAWLLAELPWTSRRLKMALQSRSPRGLPTTLTPSAFTVNPEGIVGADVLVVEDMWVSGAAVMSAAEAIKDAGARSASVLALARVVTEDHPAGPFDRELCLQCAAVRRVPDSSLWPDRVSPGRGDQR